MSVNWKIYTKKGDTGETSLLGGSRVLKNHPRIEAYGTIDELNAFTGFLRDQIRDERTEKVLLRVMEVLFIAESLLAAENSESRSLLSAIREEDITLLEIEIDFMNESLTEISNFILPGGHLSVSSAHIARTVCRRAERLVISLQAECEVDFGIIRFLNRLSDYFFILARKLSKDNNAAEIVWKVNTKH
jgi:cob(I)alamin adenosyltransferase